MLGSVPAQMWIRSYGATSSVHLHDFAQLVLPLAGAVAMDIGGREAVLKPGLAAFVDRDTRHEQIGQQANRALIVDFDPACLDPAGADRLASCPVLPLTQEASSLIDYMGSSLSRNLIRPAIVAQWMPLLLDALSSIQPRPRSRLAGLLAIVEGAPFDPWTASTMAARAGLSASRLHAVFRQELDTTPRAWLAELRLSRVREWLAHSSLSIAEVAYRGGYADQSALTRAMRKATGLTPAAYRRQVQESRPKLRES